MPDTVRVIISDEPPGSEFADTVPVERVKPCPLTVATSTSSLYVMVMVSAESTEAAVIRGGGAMLFATAAATKLAREFGWDAVSSMLPVLLEYARLMTSSLSSVSLRERVTISSLDAIALIVGFAVMSPDSTKSPGAAEFTVISSDKMRLIVVGLAVPMDGRTGAVEHWRCVISSTNSLVFCRIG